MKHIAYLISQYPAPSHTFIQTEVEALRAQGLTIDTYSIRKGAVEQDCSAKDLSALKNTQVILQTNIIKILFIHIKLAFKRPFLYFNTLLYALSHRVPGVKSLIFAFFYFIEAGILSHFLLKRSTCHLHNHFGNAGAIVGCIASKLTGIPWSFTIHGLSEFEYPAGLLLHKKAKYAKFMACASYFVQAQAMHLVSCDLWEKFIIVRCGIKIRKPSPAKKINKKCQLICVGRLSPEKGQCGLLAAMDLLNKTNVAIELSLIGGGKDEPMLKEKISQYNLDESVVLYGSQSNKFVLKKIYESDILVLPSLMEGLPVVLMEAMALGVPVIAPRIAGIPELVTKDCGILYTPSKWDELADKIYQMITNPEQRKMISQNAEIKIRSEYDIETSIIPLLKSIKSCTEQKHSVLMTG